ncbi:MAG: DUF1491 family protein [Elsteraceae bacterium]
METPPPRLKAELWIQAQIRRCMTQNIPAVVVKRGDADAGGLLIKHNLFQSGCRVLVSVARPEGGFAWMSGAGPNLVAEAEADAYIARQRSRDPDLWVLEIEDARAQWRPDEPVL